MIIVGPFQLKYSILCKQRILYFILFLPLQALNPICSFNCDTSSTAYFPWASLGKSHSPTRQHHSPYAAPLPWHQEILPRNSVGYFVCFYRGILGEVSTAVLPRQASMSWEIPPADSPSANMQQHRSRYRCQPFPRLLPTLPTRPLMEMWCKYLRRVAPHHKTKPF